MKKFYLIACIISLAHTAEKQPKIIQAAINKYNNSTACLERVSRWFTEPEKCLERGTKPAAADSVIAFHTVPLIIDRYYNRFCYDYRAGRSSRDALDKIKSTPAIIDFYDNFTGQYKNAVGAYEIGRNAGTIIHRTFTTTPEHDAAGKGVETLLNKKDTLLDFLDSSLENESDADSKNYCSADESSIIAKKDNIVVATSPYATILLQLKQ